ncbi:hypothetical protein EWB00_000522, partial [Schistosoma japonicum]
GCLLVANGKRRQETPQADIMPGRESNWKFPCKSLPRSLGKSCRGGGQKDNKNYSGWRTPENRPLREQAKAHHMSSQRQKQGLHESPPGPL